MDDDAQARACVDLPSTNCLRDRGVYGYKTARCPMVKHCNIGTRVRLCRKPEAQVQSPEASSSRFAGSPCLASHCCSQSSLEPVAANAQPL